MLLRNLRNSFQVVVTEKLFLFMIFLRQDTLSQNHETEVNFAVL